MLEEEAGFPIFRRTTRGIDLTERGRTFLYEAERIASDVLSLTDTARRLRGAILDTFFHRHGFWHGADIHAAAV